MNPLPQLLSLLRDFAREPIATLYRLFKSYEGFEDSVIRVILRWALGEGCSFNALVAITNEELGAGYGDVLLLLPIEFASRLEKACEDAKKLVQKAFNEGLELKEIIDMLGRRWEWLERLVHG